MACSDDEDQSSNAVENLTFEYANLEIGNYWIYDWYTVMPDGSESLFNKTDSLFVSGDTTIEDRTYLVLSGERLLDAPDTRLLFDSANTVYIYPSRRVFFTLDETIEEVKDLVLARGVFSLDNTLSSIEVPAGNFDCVNYKGLLDAHDPDYEHGQRVNNKFFAEGVGLVLTGTQFFSSANNLEGRMVRYGSE